MVSHTAVDPENTLGKWDIVVGKGNWGLSTFERAFSLDLLRQSKSASNKAEYRYWICSRLLGASNPQVAREECWQTPTRSEPAGNGWTGTSLHTWCWHLSEYSWAWLQIPKEFTSKKAGFCDLKHSIFQIVTVMKWSLGFATLNYNLKICVHTHLPLWTGGKLFYPVA